MGRPVGPGGPKSAVVTLRLTPRTRFGLALLSRVGHTSASAVVEQALEGLFYGEGPGTLERRTSASAQRIALLDAAWDERPWLRLGRLALLAPELLNAVESSVWKRVSEDARYWAKGRPPQEHAKLEAAMMHDTLALEWPAFAAAKNRR